MILHRFCSKAEFDTYKAGDILLNTVNHRHNGFGGSLSRGFCFFKGNVTEWARRLNGLVSFDVLLTVDVSPDDVVKSQGRYADWSKDDGRSLPPIAAFTEYCTSSYNNKSFRFVSADFTFACSRRFYSSSVLISCINNL